MSPLLFCNRLLNGTGVCYQTREKEKCVFVLSAATTVLLLMHSFEIASPIIHALTTVMIYVFVRQQSLSPVCDATFAYVDKHTQKSCHIIIVEAALFNRSQLWFSVIVIKGLKCLFYWREMGSAESPLPSFLPPFFSCKKAVMPF